MFLLVGLGNPGERYALNRHNVGFMAADAIAERWKFGPWKRRFHGLAAEGKLDGERTLILKPATFMNDSDRSVVDAMRFLKIPQDDLVVIHDEIDLAPGKLRVKTGGGDAGHNGLRAVTAALGSDYRRMRIGVGHPGARELVHHWVLQNFAKSDRDWLLPLLAAIAETAPLLAKGDDAGFASKVALLTKPQRPAKPRPAESKDA